MVCYYYPAESFGARIGVEGVGLLLDILTLAGGCALGDGFGEDCKEFADVAAGEAGEGGEVAFSGEFDGGFGFVL